MKNKIRKAIIPAAGLGTRFLPATKASPKEMLPVVDKPVIQYVVEEAVSSGIELIIIVTGRGKNAIENHFDISFELEHTLKQKHKEEDFKMIRDISRMVNFAYIRQREPLGLGHAVLVAEELIGNEPFAVFLGDDIIVSKTPCMKQMVDLYERLESPILGVLEVEKEDVGKYGIVGGGKIEDRIFNVTKMVEKPKPEKAPSNLAIIGRYILTPDIFPILHQTAPDSSSEIQLTDALHSLLKKRSVYAYLFEGRRYDTGDRIGFLEATVEIALSRADLRDEFLSYLKTLLKNEFK